MRLACSQVLFIANPKLSVQINYVEGMLVQTYKYIYKQFIKYIHNVKYYDRAYLSTKIPKLVLEVFKLENFPRE